MVEGVGDGGTDVVEFGAAEPGLEFVEEEGFAMGELGVPVLGGARGFAFAHGSASGGGWGWGRR